MDPGYSSISTPSKNTTPRNTTPKTASPRKTQKKNTTPGTQVSSAKANKQTDISQYFIKLTGPLSCVEMTPNGFTLQSPATQFLNRIGALCDSPSLAGNSKPRLDAAVGFSTPVSCFCATKTAAEVGTPVLGRPNQNKVDDVSLSVARMSINSTPANGNAVSSKHHMTTRRKSLLQSTPQTAQVTNKQCDMMDISSNTPLGPSPGHAFSKTTMTCKPMDITESSKAMVPSTETGDLAKINRRRTLFTPRRMEQTLNVIKEDETQPKIRAMASDAAGEVAEAKEDLVENQQPTPRTQSFCSSTQIMEGRRRTFFDVSLDIITKQMQNINKKTKRRSLAITTISTTYQDCESEPDPEHKPSEPTTLVNGDIDEKMEKVKPSQQEASNEKAAINGENAAAAAVKPKKRKLFVPNENQFGFSSPLATSTAASNASSGSAVKRRRTLMTPKTDNAAAATSAIKTLEKPTKSMTNAAKNRRSTMFFEPSSLKAAKKPGCDQRDLKDKCESNAQAKSSTTTKTERLMACTNMHKEQMDIIHKAIEMLGGFKLEKCVSDATTHVVTLEPRRTLNLIRGLVRGLWILNYSWIVASMEAGVWLQEEQFELTDFSRAIKICRAERQAFGSNYKCELFRDLGPFYISSRCGNIPREDLVELILSCSGKITEYRRNAKYFLCNTCKVIDDKFYVTAQWFLDSITQMQLMKLSKYCAPASASALVPTASAATTKAQGGCSSSKGTNRNSYLNNELDRSAMQSQKV